MPKLAIIGAGGHGKVIADIALCSEKWDDIVFFDDAFPSISSIEHWRVQGNTEAFISAHTSFDGVVVAIGNNKIRLEIHNRLLDSNCNIVTLIHPHSVVSPFATIGAGTVIMAGAVVNPFATIGNTCVINTNSVVEHDCFLADAVHISPNVALGGGVKVGRYSWIGIGVSVKQLVTIGDHVIAGAGSVVIQDLIQPGTYIGCPAKSLIK